jgi:ribosomal protein S16
MKNINRLLKKTNLKPKERVILFVHNAVKEEQEGKSILSEADKHDLIEGWKPDTNEEAMEYNRYIEGWRTAGFAELDAQTTYLQATNSYLRASKYISYVLYNNYAKEGKTIKESMANKAFKSLLEKDKGKKALNLVLDYLGLELDYTIYLYAFELAGKELQKDLLALYPDAKTERDYLEQQEIIYNLFDGKDKPTQEAKERLAEFIADSCYNKYFDEWNFRGHFADIPLLEILNKWGRDNKAITIKPEDLNKHLKDEKEYKDEDEEAGDLLDTVAKDLTQKLTAYAKESKREIRGIIKETVLKWLDEGLLEEYKPLFKSDEKATCNEQKTKLTHKEVFKKWLDVKAKATETIEGLIKRGELKTEERTKNLRDIEGIVKSFTEKTGKEEARQGEDTQITKTIITGKSIYNHKGNYQFIKDFKKQADDFRVFGGLILFLRGCSFVGEYSTLLGFKELFKKISNIYEIDLTYKINKWINSFEEELNFLKMEFLMLLDNMTLASYEADRVYYLTETYLDELLKAPFNPDNTKPDFERVRTYFKEFERILGDDFKL